MKPLIDFLRAFDDLNEETKFIFTCMLVVWSTFLFIGIPVGVVYVSDKLIIQNQPTCEEVRQ
jgi:hypothetical protein